MPREHRSITKCGACARTFTSPQLLQEHVDSIHRGLKKYACVVCGDKFSRSERLHTHQRRRHGNSIKKGIGQSSNVDDYEAKGNEDECINHCNTRDVNQSFGESKGCTSSVDENKPKKAKNGGRAAEVSNHFNSRDQLAGDAVSVDNNKSENHNKGDWTINSKVDEKAVFLQKLHLINKDPIRAAADLLSRNNYEKSSETNDFNTLIDHAEGSEETDGQLIDEDPEQLHAEPAEANAIKIVDCQSLANRATDVEIIDLTDDDPTDHTAYITMVNVDVLRKSEASQQQDYTDDSRNEICGSSDPGLVIPLETTESSTSDSNGRPDSSEVQQDHIKGSNSVKGCSTDSIAFSQQHINKVNRNEINGIPDPCPGSSVSLDGGGREHANANPSQADSSPSAMEVQPGKAFSCRLCRPPAVFETAKGLMTHQRFKHNGKVHQCEECPRAYKLPNQLTDHVGIVHRGVKMHACAVCGEAFGYNLQLYHHTMAAHSSTKKSPEAAAAAAAGARARAAENGQTGNADADESITMSLRPRHVNGEQTNVGNPDPKRNGIPQGATVNREDGDANAGEGQMLNYPQDAKRKSAVDGNPGQPKKANPEQAKSFSSSGYPTRNGLHVNDVLNVGANNTATNGGQLNQVQREKANEEEQDDEIEILEEVSSDAKADNAKINFIEQMSVATLQSLAKINTRDSSNTRTGIASTKRLTRTPLNAGTATSGGDSRSTSNQLGSANPELPEGGSDVPRNARSDVAQRIQQGNAKSGKPESSHGGIANTDLSTGASARAVNNLDQAPMNAIVKAEEDGSVSDISHLSTKGLRAAIDQHKEELSRQDKREGQLVTRIKFINIERKQAALTLEKIQFTRDGGGQTSPELDAVEQSTQDRLAELEVEEKRIAKEMRAVELNKKQIDVNLELLDLHLESRGAGST